MYWFLLECQFREALQLKCPPAPKHAWISPCWCLRICQKTNTSSTDWVLDPSMSSWIPCSRKIVNCCFWDKTSTIESSEEQRMKTYLISTNHSQSVVCVTGDVENARGPVPLVPDAPGEMTDLIELLPIEHFCWRELCWAECVEIRFCDFWARNEGLHFDSLDECLDSLQQWIVNCFCVSVSLEKLCN